MSDEERRACKRKVNASIKDYADIDELTPEVRQWVLAAVEHLNYNPSILACDLATNKTKHIAILVKSLQNPYYSTIHDGVQSVANREGYIVSVLSTHNFPRVNSKVLLVS